LFGAGADCHDRLARIDADAHLQIQLRIGLVQLRERLQDPQPCSHRTFRVIFMRHGGTAHSHHRVADELLDGRSVALDYLPQARVVRADACSDVFGIAPVRCAGESDEVAEKNGNNFPLFECRWRRKRRTA
jgi:hypothetical protein